MACADALLHLTRGAGLTPPAITVAAPVECLLSLPGHAEVLVGTRDGLQRCQVVVGTGGLDLALDLIHPDACLALGATRTGLQVAAGPDALLVIASEFPARPARPRILGKVATPRIRP